MAASAPGMVWCAELALRSRSVVGWEGEAPPWGGERSEPDGLDAFLGARRLKLRVYYPEAFPMVPAEIVPLDPRPPMEVRGFQQWHVNPDGSLCNVQSAYDWRPGRDTAAELVLKASGWFIEYLLLSEGRIDRMTERGIGVDTSLDDLIAGIE
jgi:hypothetical protein